MKGFVHGGYAGSEGLALRDQLNEKSPSNGEVKIKLKASGLNHRDLFIPDRHDASEPDVVLGSDGAGIVIEVGSEVKDVKVGDHVVINPGLGWRENSAIPPEGFQIVGFPGDGTFAETIVVPAENAVLKPEALSFEEAAVIGLAGLTAYRALFTRGQLKSNQTVFIPGIGGGVATFLLQFAKAAGARVIVSSRSEEKREAALKLGADKALSNDENWAKVAEHEHVDLVIESVGAATFNRSLSLLKRGGTLVIFGSSTGDSIDFDLRTFFYGQYNLLGSTMGSAEEFNEMIDFVANHSIKPVIDETYSLNEIEKAFKHLSEANQFGKLAVSI
ncbi:zinc-binding dehydrogenase [Guptibacillus hwajinpoensis]|uniref:Zinc-binding alcohol dehydrogenase/oxidoreductase n=1 Tax=Guptibacillus hwajinpoensis TaxID=208199 RepID=A0ABU0K4A2_9BACL|nr:zinc-binding dehydrogenase [Alkalihalobacillus hemicentroti]MDQ0484187.1 zinc-binding alcohol dehydrogenase/oxidoreductase [Alkalihalobacillus hemicentroti]